MISIQCLVCRGVVIIVLEVKSYGNHFHFLKEPFPCTENMAKFFTSSAADVQFISKRKRQNDILSS